MTGIICRTILVVLAVIGITELVRIFFNWLLKPDFRGKGILILQTDGKMEDVEYILRSAEESLKQIGWKGEKKILCVPGSNLDEEAQMTIRILSRNHPAIQICPKEELSQILNQEFANT